MENTAPFQPWTDEDQTKNVKTEKELVDDAKLHRENVNHPKHRQTASYVKESIVPSNISPGPSSASDAGVPLVPGKESRMDSAKVASMQQIVENALSPEGRQAVAQLLEAVEALSGAERLLLYLRLPTGVPPHDPLKQPINPLGSRAELQQTVTWIQTHLEVDPDVSLPKQDVYDEYIAHCMSSNMKPLSTADFGKVMKQVYPTVRPRRLGTRGNSRYCYAGLRKKIKLEVPQLPDLGESSKEPTSMPVRENERIICDWAESKLGIKFANITELSRHLAASARAPPPAASPPPLAPVLGPVEEAPGQQLMKQLKRKIQGQGTPGRPKKNKESTGESPPSTSFTQHAPVKLESELLPEGYYQPYAHGYDAPPPRAFPGYGAPPPRAHPHPPLAPHAAPPPPHEYRPEPYAFDPPYARDLTLPDSAPNVPINLSTDASLDLSTERGEWPRRRPPDPAPRLHLPGKKLILETYQSETRAGPPRPAPPPAEPRAEYLPKKMRATEILTGKLAATRQRAAAAAEPAARSEPAFLESKNLTNRSISTAAALAREEQEAASPTRATKAPTPKCAPNKFARTKEATPDGPPTPDSCCGLDGINIRTGMICEEKHTEILNRERVISICNIDKHDLDDYLNEGSSQEHEEELLQYFQQRHADPDPAAVAPAADPGNAGAATAPAPAPADASVFLEAGQDPQDDHSQGKSEKISQLRELLAKNLKNQSGSNSTNTNQEPQIVDDNGELQVCKSLVPDGAFKPVASDLKNGQDLLVQPEVNGTDQCNSIPNESNSIPFHANHGANQLLNNVGGTHLCNGNSHNEPQSPTTRTQQYDFVPISDGCHSPGNFHSKSPLGFGQRGHGHPKVNQPAILGGSLQTSPISHSTAASPFVSPRNTPVPRSRQCPRPIPKNGRKRRNPLSLGVGDSCSKPFAIPNDQKFLHKSSIGGASLKYCQPMSAPPSPNLSQYKNPMLQNSPGIQNGNSICLNFMPNALFREHMNGEPAQPHSADPLSSEVSRFFQEPIVNFRLGHDPSFRSQSVPLKQGVNNLGLLSYNNTPVGSVPPTPVPNEFCDFGSLDACDISKAGLNPETLDKIYDAIDSSNDVLNAGAAPSLLNSSSALSNGCDPLPDQQMLTEELGSYIPGGGDLLDRGQFGGAFPGDAAPGDNVDEFLKRTSSIEFDLADLVSDRGKYYTSRSVPSTPLPYKRAAPGLQLDSRRSREPFAPDGYPAAPNGISSKSVPSTPQLAEDRSVFSYSNRDFLINGNSVEVCGSTQIRSAVESEGLASPLDMLREDMLDPLTPAADLLADLDKIDGPPYVDL